MSRVLMVAVGLALVGGAVAAPLAVQASATAADISAGAEPPSTAAPQGSASPPPPPVSAPTSAAPGAAPAPPRAVTLTFDNADIESVIQALSEIAGFSYVLAPDVRGTVTVRTSGAIRREDVLPVFFSVLEAHGFTAVKAGDLYKIVRTETARERAIPTVIDPPPRPSTVPGVAPPGLPDRPVTHILAPRVASAAALAGAVRPLVSSRGTLIAHPAANVLIVVDTAANVDRVADVVRRLDTDLGAEEVHVIPLRYADASELAAILSQVFAGADLARPPAIVADPRTNSLIIRARRAELDAIGRLLGRD